MATYAIGDIHGCFKTLQALLRDIGFQTPRDRLWLVGDLVNRGPKSLEVLRWAAENEAYVTTVLGNHDLHLLARAAGATGARARDTLDDVLAAKDRKSLIRWLLARPFFHREDRFAMVHAGLHPAWKLGAAARWSARVSAKLQESRGAELIVKTRSKPVVAWGQTVSDSARYRMALYAFTLMRACRRDGRPCPGFSGPPSRAPKACVPWFDLPSPRSRKVTLVTGHWAALGVRQQPGLVALDSGCIWGGALTAYRLDDGALFQVANRDGVLSA
jgi:bis(5'-nucleosyl)-tetraphosphatase (symmetrical)